MTHTVIADSTGSVLVGFWDGFTVQYPVIAWHVVSDSKGVIDTNPVIVESLPGVFCIKTLGRWIFPEDVPYEDEDSAIQHGFALYKVWERLRQKAAESKPS